MTVTPYGKKESKKEEVRDMFDHIAPTYDLLNRVLSLRIDRRWRRKTIQEAAKGHPARILDVATGTADLAIEAARLQPQEIIGADIAAEMLRIGQRKIGRKNLSHLIRLVQADSENLPFGDGYFDLVTVAFGVRNFEHVEQGIREMQRVLRPGGRLLVLEFSSPGQPLFNRLYQFYFKRILPLLGRMISRDLSAYRYLYESVSAFPQRDEFTSLLTDAGFRDARYTPLTMGIACLYSGVK